jgi:hypothetical protein
MTTRQPPAEEPAHDVLAAEEFPLGDADPGLHVEPAHDVLAADEFAVGASDPALHVERAHDVLAADEFAVGAADPELRRGPIVLPGDPTGIEEPHDVLAAEEFPMPAHAVSTGAAAGTPGPGGDGPLDYSRLRGLLLVAGALLLLRRLLRRR